MSENEERGRTAETTRSKTPGKLPYTPPSITRVPLRPEEAVLGHCKSSANSGPLHARCNIPSPCSVMGS